MKTKYLLILVLPFLFLNSCGGKMGADARKVSPDPKKRVEKNISEGRGFRLMETMGAGKGGNFEFASSNELWRATLDTIDFMPLTSANYSGGILITDWYSDNQNSQESIKIVVRFLTNEIRTDAIDLKIFYKNCLSINNCSINERSGNLVNELKKEILKKAAIYKKESTDKNYKPYVYSDPKKN